MVLKGSVGAFKYYSEANHFGIFVLDTDEVDEGNIVVKGNVFGISEGDYIEVTGEETDHPLYGHQIKMTSFKAVQPSDSGSVYLSIPGGRSAPGKVTVQLKNSTHELKAIADEDLPSGTAVVIREQLADSLFLVSRKS